MTDKKSAEQKCGAETTVGSYPGEQVFWCEQPKGHRGEHTATVFWACGVGND